MIAHILQRQIPLGTGITLSLKNGRQLTGSLEELGRQHLTLETDQGLATVLIDAVMSWETQPISNEPAEVSDAPRLADPGKCGTGDQDRTVSDTPTEAAQENDSAGADAVRRMIEIDAVFTAQTQAARLEMKAADFTFPSDEIAGPRRKEALQSIERIRNKYEYAQKISELGSQFGRIQPITNELQDVIQLYPGSPSLTRHLAYFKSVMGSKSDALRLYKTAARAMGEPTDWCNVAALASSMGDSALACYALHQLFRRQDITVDSGAWYSYIRLLVQNGNHALLCRFTDRSWRPLTADETDVLFETAVYVLNRHGRTDVATRCLREWLRGTDRTTVLEDALSNFEGRLSPEYEKVDAELTHSPENAPAPQDNHRADQRRGHLTVYKADRGFGYIADSEGTSYFFHRSAIADASLLRTLISGGAKAKILLTFETKRGPQGDLAVNVTPYRTTDELFGLAQRCADEGDYSKAIAYLKKVLTADTRFPNAQQCYETWRTYARVTGLPKGGGPYARAKRAHMVEKNPERATELLRHAIDQGDNVESAVKDLTALLVQCDRPQDAINVLLNNKHKVADRRWANDQLTSAYQKAGQYDTALAMLNKDLADAASKDRRAYILLRIANCYLQQDHFAQAEAAYRDVLDLGLDSRTAQRNLALCLIKQLRYAEAEQILSEIAGASPDAQAADLLDAIGRARETGQTSQIDDIVAQSAFSDFSSEVSAFTRFSLEQCEYQGVPPARLQHETFDRSDVRKLEDLATQFGTRNPRGRAEHYLSAAKITSRLHDGDEPGQFYRYLCRSFASRGDACVAEGRPLDVAREWYTESLSVYDTVYAQDSNRKHREQDAANALVRFLYSILDRSLIPMTPNIPSIDETLGEILGRPLQKERVLDAIAYVVTRSQYAAERVLNRLHAEPTLQSFALDYLRQRGLESPSTKVGIETFVGLWKDLRRRSNEQTRGLSAELKFAASIEMTTASTDNCITRLRGVEGRFSLDLDRQRLVELQTILEMVNELCKQPAFEEQERLCFQIDARSEDLRREIKENPTRVSVEHLYRVVETLKDKTKKHIQDLYERSVPQINLRLPVESYVPNVGQRIEVQVVVANKMGCSPAESLQLVLQEDDSFFVVDREDIRIDGSLRGGQQEILRIPVTVTDLAVESQTFSLPIYAQYRTRSGDVTATPIGNFPIRLYPEAEFEEIANPYAYAEGGVVVEKDMFYGRQDLISNVSRVLRNGPQGKCFVVFGQKRAGKSSVLFHLQEELKTDTNILVVNIGNIGSLLDQHSQVPLLYQILGSVLTKLNYSIEDRNSTALETLEIDFPTDVDFYDHPIPVAYFKDILERFTRAAARSPVWASARVVLLIDEFSYIYGLLQAGRIPGDFMKNWKALLQANLFSAVLVGQDVMPKFKAQFPNEFGTSQDERVSYLSREDALKLIDEPIRIGGKQGDGRYRERAIDRILDLTEGSPFYIQIICNRLVEYMNRKRATLVTEADVEQVKSELIRGVNALSLDKFHNLISSGDTSTGAISDDDALTVLKLIAVNSHLRSCSRERLVCETDQPIDLILDDLVNREVLHREPGHLYRIRVGLFREWLVANQ